MIPNEVVIHKNVITEEERILLKEHAIHLLDSGETIINTATPGNFRNLKSYFSLEEMPEIHIKLFYTVVKRLELDNPVIDPSLGIIVSIIKPNGFIHPHTDKYIDTPRHKHLQHMRNVRFNVMVERGEDNCYNPRVNRKFYQVNKCDGWCFGASEYMHGTEKITGPEDRIVYQFGFCMDAI